MSISKRDQKTHHFRPILKSSRHTSLQHCQQLKPLIKRLFVGCVAVTEDNLQTYLLRHDNRTEGIQKLINDMEKPVSDF
ncbi:hypothetical protein RB195_017347 [Necator americanus]|uniref:Uncharacterized protein n=1 Tax=Necator americanus TaxID=51031 RepID=A0ABR1C4T1_NECAM